MARIFSIIILILLQTAALFANTLESGIYPAVEKENQTPLIEILRIQITNDKDGLIQISENKGKSWQEIGKVLSPAEKVNEKGYTASRWAQNGCVAAVAVNAIHLRTSYNAQNDLGIIFSLIPRELKNVPFGYASYRSPEASIYTDIPAGTSIFGGRFAPFVGNGILMNEEKMPAGYVPQIGDILTIIVEKPQDYPAEIIFENRFGGLIKIIYKDGQEKFIGQVLKPVVGVGRFLGTQYAEVGRIRANHTGVIDVSTSPFGDIGGFQIIPARHGMDQEMITARTLTQWMVVSSLNGLDPSPDGVAPLFSKFIRPEWEPLDLANPKWLIPLLERFLVEVKIAGSENWQIMPEWSLTRYMGKSLPAWAMTAMKNVTHVRILFPVYGVKY